jgi:hypothetical protein
MRKLTLVLVVVFALSLTVGCMGGPKVEKIKEPKESSSMTGEKGEPDWVSRGGGVYEGEYGKAIYAVGSARKAPSYHIMMSQARTRARAELSSILSVQVQRMTKDFTETAGDLFEPETQSAVEYFQDVTRQITNNVLVGSESVATWKASDGTLFVLMKIPLDTVVDVFKNETKKAMKRKEAAERLKVKSDDALKEMDKLLDSTANEYTNKPAEEWE